LPLAAASAPGRRGGRLQGWIHAGAARGNVSDDLPEANGREIYQQKWRLQLNLNLAARLAAAGQDFTLLNKGQRGFSVINLAPYQAHTTGAAVAFTALKFHAEVMRLQRGQQIGMILCALQAGA